MVETDPFEDRMARMFKALDLVEKAANDLRDEANKVLSAMKGVEDVPTEEG